MNNYLKHIPKELGTLTSHKDTSMRAQTHTHTIGPRR